MSECIARREYLGLAPLVHIKHFLGGVFRYARRQGALNNPNPMHEVEIPRARPAGETHAYLLEEEIQTLTILPEPAATVVATAPFTGARKGELRAFLWENYDGFEIRVMKSAWRGYDVCETVFNWFKEKSLPSATRRRVPRCFLLERHDRGTSGLRLVLHRTSRWRVLRW
jgi:integrase